jgi:hypothetical protein
VVLLVIPFVAKIVVSPEGLEYHNLTHVLKTNWHDLGVVQDFNMHTGATTLLVPGDPEVTVRRWARYAPWDVERGAAMSGIPISHFGGFRGRRLRADLADFAPHLLGAGG